MRIFVKTAKLWGLEEITDEDLASLPKEIQRIIFRISGLYTLADYRSSYHYPRLS